ncbi:uncharacterized protein F5147DRAFT_743994 [Suillus discolor]|uniref:Uncharacterized protein n=1 Tax=Suillus discolor TaxID=1912936 RepID=A0A9P7JXI4_9AGAM|nr:uncharacterized protein F5147DRAFT_743994 [Suillus discolor]KAG2114299.1 hypothetical protein F5147DRAFT_743994 [Suillus discolor]
MWLTSAIYLVVFNITHYTILDWTFDRPVPDVTAGHTKKVVTNAIMLSAYCIGNSAGPLINHVPCHWAVMGACYIVCPVLLLLIRVVLVRENKIRDAEPVDDELEEEYVIERITEDGKRVEVKVNKEFLDLTDRQSRDFRYVL